MDMADEHRAFEPRTDSVREARRFIRESVGKAGGDADAAELLTAELAANAVLHAQSRYEVRLCRRDGAIRVEVVNDKPEMIAHLVQASGEGGRGLAIVNELASAWGVETAEDQKIIWFELPLASK
jgi:anti-sigma regulatory factor (Ser/Thr protein kinase)